MISCARLRLPWFVLALVLWGACTRELAVFGPSTLLPADPNAADDAGNDAGTGPFDGGDAMAPPNPIESRSISAFGHSCSVLDGRLYCWGDNRKFQLGVGDDAPRTRPTQIAERSLFLEVCAGESHTCALREDGEVLCWGDNFTGALGVGDNDPRDRPTPIGKMHFARLACWANVSCAIGLAGELFCWGENFEGQLGQGDTRGSSNRSSPVAVAPHLRFRYVAVGQGHVCAITLAGELYCWGRNTQQQLGTLADQEQVRTPTQVDKGHLYRNVSTGMTHTCAIDRAGQLFCWGQDLQGSLGLAVSDGAIVGTPTRVDTGNDYTEVHASWFHTCAVRANGFLSCWGRNVEGQLGVSDTDDRNAPVRVGTASDWLAVAAGHFHTCGLRSDGIYCWGENAEETNQLGLGAPGRRFEPTPVDLPLEP